MSQTPQTTDQARLSEILNRPKEAPATVTHAIRPQAERVWVRPDVQPDESRGGIIIPDDAKDKIVTIYGTIIAVGRKCVDSHVGDHVVYNKWMGLDVEHKGETLRAIYETELLGYDEEATPVSPTTSTT